MAKTVSLPPVRVEPEMLDDLTGIAEQSGVSVYELVRVAAAEYIARHRAMVVFTDRLMAVANGETVQV